MDLAIKHTNLLILVMISEYLGFLAFGLNIGTYILSIDLCLDGFAIYLSFEFSDKLYRKIFCADTCHGQTNCHRCCIYLCWCCCTPTKLPQSVLLELKEMEKNQAESISKPTFEISKPTLSSNKSDETVTSTSSVKL